MEQQLELNLNREEDFWSANEEAELNELRKKQHETQYSTYQWKDGEKERLTALVTKKDRIIKKENRK